jgi:hypothetical protein
LAHQPTSVPTRSIIADSSGAMPARINAREDGHCRRASSGPNLPRRSGMKCISWRPARPTSVPERDRVARNSSRPPSAACWPMGHTARQHERNSQTSQAPSRVQGADLAAASQRPMGFGHCYLQSRGIQPPVIGHKLRNGVALGSSHVGRRRRRWGRTSGFLVVAPNGHHQRGHCRRCNTHGHGLG